MKCDGDVECWCRESRESALSSAGVLSPSFGGSLIASVMCKAVERVGWGVLKCRIVGAFHNEDGLSVGKEDSRLFLQSVLGGGGKQSDALYPHLPKLAKGNVGGISG